MKKQKLVLMLVLGVSMVPSVLFAAYAPTTGQQGGTHARFGAACMGSPTMTKTVSQDLAGSIQPSTPQAGVTSALDSDGASKTYSH